MTSDRVRGACPSVHAPFAELDGALFRVRLPGGRLPAPAAVALAEIVERAAAGPIELTSRANLQLRAVPLDAVDDVRDAIVAAGLAPDHASADQRRNVLASPTAGVDPDELTDTRGLVDAIAQHLVAAPTVPSHKFGVLVDGGGAVHVRGRRHDVALGAVRDANGALRYEVRIGSALPLHRAADDIVELVDEARALGVVDAIVRGRPYDHLVTRQRGGELARSIPPSRPAIGVHAQADAERSWIGALAPLGRIDPSALARVAGLSPTELRVTPWRGLVLVDIPNASAPATVAVLDDLGLVTDAEHPATLVVACVGARGCAAGEVDTHAHAQELIGRLESIPIEARPRSVHVSGCEKGCARSEPAAVSLVGAGAGRYDCYRRPIAADTEADRFGELVEVGLDPPSAIDAVLAMPGAGA